MCYIPDFGAPARGLRGYNDDIQVWWDDFRGRTAFTKPEDATLLGVLGVSAGEDGTPQLPFDR